ncbi:MDS1 and EVI1 complex locus protein EVI1-B [Nilaparvata lugens]|uniref:MDS1 and EVI1 complex locus protein EVI1-B n=1 Tax=Nilaparvata lugens TaxID=108931 RepID=UPI00193E17B9|nr:MDS1 and EVI1 complex locus protein EVI1-B [Nilaparvata lugens]
MRNCGGDDNQNKTTTTVSLHKDGHLRQDTEDKDCYKWIQSMALADDCQSYNVQLRKCCGSESVRLVVTQPLKKGEKLLMWFSDEILSLLMMPFLTPVNIQGEKNYRCHLCRKTFEYPNPLKIHIMLGCFSNGNGLWRRLSDALKSDPSKLEGTPETGPKTPKIGPTFKFSLKPTSPASTVTSNRLKECLAKRALVKGLKSPSPSLTTTSNPSPDHCSQERLNEVRPSSEPLRHSAFKPYLNSISSNQQPINQEQKWHTDALRLGPTLSSSDVFFTHAFPLFPPPTNSQVTCSSLPNMADMKESSKMLIQQAVDMETLVSSLGRSKQGHLCIYCGKVYSRKYGLKIHIRTHTGFKPLKCKYCSRPFGDPSNLNKHVRLHAEGETKYKCDQCGKVLVRRRDLERHMKSRHQLDCDELEDLRISQDVNC